MKKQIQWLQEEMRLQGVSIYYMGMADDHNSEYVSDYFRQIAYFTGFTGSAGSLFVTETGAYLWTDGRYFLQAEEQLSGSGITLMRMGEPLVPTMEEWLASHLTEEMVFGYDAKTMTAYQQERFFSALSFEPHTKAEDNLAGAIWEKQGERPALSCSPVYEWELCYSGVSRAEKIKQIRQLMQKEKCCCYVVTELSEIAWLLNLRGSDIPYQPVFLSYVVLTMQDVLFYVDRYAVTESLEKKLLADGIVIREYAAFYEEMTQWKEPLCGDKKSLNAALLREIKRTGGSMFPSLIAPQKAVKNEVEQEGERLAHQKDGVAVTRFLYWLKHLPYDEKGQLIDENHKPVTEISAAEKLNMFRQMQEHYMEQSFAPIIAAKEHGAIVHYSATKESDAVLTKDTFVLMDTGGQYLEGTTDITRTAVLGQADQKMKKLYTAVLQGHLHLQHALFKKGARGENLDILARLPLYRLGQDYLHGTGHGVGCFLNVHEAPVSIRTKIFNDDRNSAPFEAGMVTSNEPGVYLAGEFGIRLENLMLCVKEERNGAEFLEFAPLTFVPWDKDAIEVNDLTEEETGWLNEYQEMVYDQIGSKLPKEEREWLYKVTRPLGNEV